LHGLTQQGVFFVTRMKADIKYQVVGKRNVPTRGAILSDEEIVIHSGKYGVDCGFRGMSISVPN
jgi:hypothetical protein